MLQDIILTCKISGDRSNDKGVMSHYITTLVYVHSQVLCAHL